MDPNQDHHDDGQDFVLLEDKDVDDYNEDGILPQAPEVIAQILEWLQPTDFLADSSEYKKHLSSYVSGTGLWVHEEEVYRKWHDQPDHGSLWIKATAGAGKSVFAAMTTAKLAQEENVPVLFFFFRQIVATNHNPQSLVRDWIAMILHHSPPLQLAMKNYLDTRTVENVTTAELWDDLLQGIGSISKLYCVVDALDEMDIDEMPFLKKLVDLGMEKPSSVKVMLTSRPLPRIEAILKDHSVLQVRLEPIKVDRDISVYIGHRLNSRAEVNDELRHAIKQAIGARAQGSFLYARLMMDEILDHLKQMVPDVKYIQRSLDWLPVTLEDMYNGMLLDHSLRSRVSQDLQLTILQWVTHSTRPLRLLEIAAMLDFCNNSNSKVKDTKATVRAACGPLLEILEDETVSVIHHSFTEFLTDEARIEREPKEGTHRQFPVVNGGKTHGATAMTCLEYLGFALQSWELDENRARKAVFVGGPPPPPPPPNSLDLKLKQQNIKLQYPFLDYALRNWYIHVSKCQGLDEVLIQSLKTFIDVGSHAFSSWLEIAGTSFSTDITPIHVAAWAGLKEYAELLIEWGAVVNQRDGDGKTPLLWAAMRGRFDTVALLLTFVTDIDTQDSRSMTPLHYAAQGGHHAIVKLLLDAGASPLTDSTQNQWRPELEQGHFRHMPPPLPPNTGSSPLYLACRLGSTESVREMLPYLEIQDLNDALLWASAAGKSQLVSMLLKVPEVSPAVPEGEDTPLYLASLGWHFETMQILLENGADPTIRSSMNRPHRGPGRPGHKKPKSHRVLRDKQDLGPTPLHAICGSGWRSVPPSSSVDDVVRKCFEILFNAGSDIDAVDDFGRTALHLSLNADARRKSTSALPKLLLEHGANPMATDNAGNTPLHLIHLQSDSQSLIELLLEHGADINAKRSGPYADGRTPLHTMLININEADIKPLMPFVTDWNVVDNEGNTPLHCIAYQSRPHAAAVTQLLDAGADPKLRNRKGETPLHLMRDFSSESEESAFLALLEAGSSIESRDNDGNTVLLAMLACRHQDSARTVQFFVDCGAQFGVTNNEGNNALHIACKRYCDPFMVTSLIKAGVNPLQVNNEDNTVLHMLCSRYDYSGNVFAEIVDIFLKAGVPATARNRLGQTAAHLFCSTVPPPKLYGSHDPLEHFFKCDLKNCIDDEDKYGVRPIHLAATISERLIARLIQAGAKTDCTTLEGKSLLHIAARMRQSNIIGLLLDHYATISRLDMLDLPDKIRCTPLHEAAKSGRPESVAILLEAGANPKARDSVGNTPLHYCSEFEQENSLWSSNGFSSSLGNRTRHAVGTLTRDHQRPTCQDDYQKLDHDSARIREIIRLLLRFGGDAAMANDVARYPIDLARDRRLGVMVDELLATREQVESVRNDQPGNLDSNELTSSTSLLDKFFSSREHFTVDALDFDKNGNNSFLCHQLLIMGQYSTIEQLPHVGLDFTPRVNYYGYECDFLSTLTHWGYCELLEVLGKTVQSPQWVDGVRHHGHHFGQDIKPFLVEAVCSRLPNLDVVKLLVETFGANVNIQQEERSRQALGGAMFVPGTSPLHVLAVGNHWWQTEAMKYLLSKGANTELKNASGETVLHVALARSLNGSYKTREVVQILLDHDADPNALDATGLTCLSKATYDIELVRLLLKYGADIFLGTKPVLLSAIDTQDLSMVTTILEAGADCNQSAGDLASSFVSVSSYSGRRYGGESYPLHLSASPHFNTTKEKETALQITSLLLSYGANPFAEVEEDTTILHDILQQGGILEPFLELPQLELEHRDSTGRTLLHAACQSAYLTSTPREMHNRFKQRDQLDREYVERSTSARDLHPACKLYEMGSNLLAVDDDGNNALHLMLEAVPLNKEEYKRTFKLFIKDGPALVGQPNKKGFKPFHRALQMKKLWAIETLLEYGVDPFENDPQGNSPLHHLAPAMCSEKGHKLWLPLFEKFLRLGVSINQRNNLGETPVFKYYEEMASPMERDCHSANISAFKDADLFARNDAGETLLHICAKWPSDISKQHQKEAIDSFKFLMAKGLNLMIEDQNQRTALDMAAACGHNDILAMFKRDYNPAEEEGNDSPDHRMVPVYCDRSHSIDEGW
ncbi:hypothetical protein G7Y89_g2312 [Cudoniella acicularis]|uniref:NACHT domain-containing protein n=1 Tax=Cudoniella acicularis TaxID=354080 RepID=A0A8H4W8R5_9HELO|nr:hypothetical protein G7Y89_g2312 [Cudoniella acicularis]